jgi:hypothetical protein
MKKEWLVKTLAMGVVFLFIGTSFVPNITGLVDKESNQLTKEGFANLPLTTNYTNAYWKFNENSGNIAHDSSGHGYDGTIYGATWTTGYSGSALDFDGVDDYVDLDAHAENHLGFNRTDDLIISFYFKSASTDFGIIYSVSNTPEFGYMPGSHIALNPNGTLEFQIWYEGICGITLYSKNAYNDDNWHYVEVWYNGIIYPLNQTLKIYVDGVLDNSIEGEMCKFYADKFHMAKMGRKSYESTDYFDGLLDEVKIIKYPGGNQPPSINISGPTHGEVGIEYNYTFLIMDPEGDDIWFCIDWGDGTTEEWSGPYESGEEGTIRKLFYENGTYEIKAKARDVWGEGPWSSLIVIIGNQVPNPTVIDGPKSGKIGVEYEYNFSLSDSDNDLMYLRVDWGNGTPGPWQGPYESDTTVRLNHSWNQKGNFTIRAQVKDIYGAESDWGTFEVTMPRNRVSYSSLFFRFLERFPNAFPILKYISGGR